MIVTQAAPGTAHELPLLGFGLALLIGALVGVDREKKKRAGDVRTRGLRTFVLISETGAVAAWLTRVLESPWIFVGAGVLVVALVIAGYMAETRTSKEPLGLTTEVAALTVYLLGGLAVLGHSELAVALAIATAAVLAFKEPMHVLVDRIGREDLRAGLTLLIATFIVLPVLPNRTLDPWHALNPFAIWLLVILISALSFLGYVATRILGPERGLALTGLTGGLVSSTAITLGFARQSREPLHEPTDVIASGLLLAWAVMCVRVVVITGFVHAPLLAPLALPMGVMACTSLVAAVVLYSRGSRAQADGSAAPVKLQNPFRLSASIRFALFFALVLLAVAILRERLPAAGMYAIAMLAGLTDVDAITLSMANLARDGGALDLAACSITIAALSNTLLKCGLVIALGSRELRVRVVIVTALVVAGGVLTLLLR